jgi:hypothetical protein
MRRVYELDGTQFDGLAGLARHFSPVVLGDGHVWNGNLDALNDILRGGFGTPEEGFVIRMRHSSAARSALGHAETARWFAERSKTCHSSNRPQMLKRMDEARAGIGETLFDMVVAIIKRHGPGGDESEHGVVLELDSDEEPTVSSEEPPLNEADARSRWIRDYCTVLEDGCVFAAVRPSMHYRCPCCGLKTLRTRSGFEICQVCFWEDDGQDEGNAAVVRGGPNGALSLATARANFRRIGACEQAALAHVRPPRQDEV